MRKSEALKLVKVLAAAFPGQAFPGDSQRLYAAAIMDLDLEDTASGISDLVATVERLPSVAALREASRARSGALPGVLWSDAWSEAITAARRSGRYRPIPEFSSARLAETVRAIGWDSFLNTPTKDHGTLRAQFRDIWRDKADAERVHAVTTRGEIGDGDREPLALAAELGAKLRLKP
jgi:hypothetical protein